MEFLPDTFMRKIQTSLMKSKTRKILGEFSVFSGFRIEIKTLCLLSMMEVSNILNTIEQGQRPLTFERHNENLSNTLLLCLLNKLNQYDPSVIF